MYALCNKLWTIKVYTYSYAKHAIVFVRFITYHKFNEESENILMNFT